MLPSTQSVESFVISSRLSNCKQRFSWAEFYVGMYVKIQHTSTIKGISAFDIHLTIYGKRFLSSSVITYTLEHNIWLHSQSVKLTSCVTKTENIYQIGKNSHVYLHNLCLYIIYAYLLLDIFGKIATDF